MQSLSRIGILLGVSYLMLCSYLATGFSLLPSSSSSSSSPKTASQYPTSFLRLASSFQEEKEKEVDGTIKTKWSMIESIPVQTLDKTTTTLGDMLSFDGKDSTIVVSCLSHFGDFNAWELTQQYIAAIDSGRISSDCTIVLIGIGSVEAAQQFANDLELETYQGKLTLLADERGSVTSALGCYRGWLSVDEKHKQRYPDADVNPYLKLLGMIFGFGSPGTIPRVLYGYFGDVDNDNGPTDRKWVVDSLLQGSKRGRFPNIPKESFAGIPDDSPLRPFELATLRLQTGLHIVSKFPTLGPKDGDLLTRMGGTFVFNGQECIWNYFDQGILVYANMEDICNVVNSSAVKGQRYIPSSDAKVLKLERKERREAWMAKQSSLVKEEKDVIAA